jgi:O-antigen ligase
VYVTVNQYIVNADSPAHVLFGYGYMQSVDFAVLPTTIFDNSELDVYLYAGVCGVVLYLALLLAMFVFAVRQWRTSGRVAWLTAASLLFATPLFSTLNIDLDQPFFVFVFALVAGGVAMAPRASELQGQSPLNGERTGFNAI